MCGGLLLLLVFPVVGRDRDGDTQREEEVQNDENPTERCCNWEHDGDGKPDGNCEQDVHEGSDGSYRCHTVLDFQ